MSKLPKQGEMVQIYDGENDPRKPSIELLRWVAEFIQLRNMNGKVMLDRCLLCPGARLKRQRCKHTEIWEAGGH